MDVREMLVELLNDCQAKGSWLYGIDCKTGEVGGHEMSSVDIANYLTENCVTVQEWISVKDRLPEHGDVVICFMKFGEHRILQWDNVSRWWLGYGQGDDWQKSDVTHWAKMPQPPKGE